MEVEKLVLLGGLVVGVVYELNMFLGVVVLLVSSLCDKSWCFVVEVVVGLMWCF